jgi:hypothetical protein
MAIEIDTCAGQSMAAVLVGVVLVVVAAAAPVPVESLS